MFLQLICGNSSTDLWNKHCASRWQQNDTNFLQMSSKKQDTPHTVSP